MAGKSLAVSLGILAIFVHNRKVTEQKPPLLIAGDRYLQPNLNNDDEMKLDNYKPKNDVLKKYIDSYYFISENKKSKQIKYYTFPNNFCILSVNQNAKVELKENSYFISS
ncbi:MAG TPA: hypothetical protein VKY33_03250, partial [Flavobacterium sp.]|nr:hypothetical protein [Flavobacterium sp.]